MSIQTQTFFAAIIPLLILGCSKNDSPSTVEKSQTPTPAAETVASSLSGAQRSMSNLDWDLLGRFRALNSSVAEVNIFSIMPTVSYEDRGRYVAIANGRTPNMSHEDRFTNLAHAEDIFGVFVLDHGLTKVIRRLGLFISPRLGDYDAWIIRTTNDSVIVCGRGAMYGDGQQRWAFALDSVRSAQAARERDSIFRNPPPPSANDDRDEGDEAVSPAPDCPGVVAK